METFTPSLSVASALPVVASLLEVETLKFPWDLGIRLDGDWDFARDEFDEH